RLAQHLHTLLDAALADDARPLATLPLAAAGEAAVIERANATAQPIPTVRVMQTIAELAAARPKRTAVRAADGELDYAALDARANRLARHLGACGVQRGQAVAVSLPRGVDLPVALLAILKLGAHYVPLDPTHPPARRAAVLADSGARHGVHRGVVDPAGGAVQWIDLGAADAVIAAQAATAPNVDVAAEDIAYLIYTSGSTGKPKGVPIRHESLSNLLMSMASAPGFGERDTLLAVTTVAFDIATLELLLPLMCGATLAIADDLAVTDGAALGALIEQHGVSVMQATPAGWRLLLEAGFKSPPGFRAWCGGEAIDTALAVDLLGSGATLWNLYGPTETTIWSSALRLTPALLEGPTVPIGGPIANTRFEVRDTTGQTTPVDVAGELCIGGVGVTPGYRDRPQLNAEAFVDGDHGRVYRAGDRARWNGDGTLTFLGRRDSQVKLRGFRIELGEIEASAVRFAGVDAAVANVVTSAGSESLLALYVRGAAVDVEALRAHLATLLPTYMVPGFIVPLEALPLSPNGKWDRAALPDPRDAAPTREVSAGRAPETPTERELASIWSALLGVAITNAETDFFAAGGHSLTAARLVARIEATLQVRLPLVTVFEQRRLDRLATAIDEQLARGASPARARIRRQAPGSPLHLSRAQQRQWVLAKLEPNNPSYHLPAALRLRWPVERTAMTHALATLVERHDALRMAFDDHGGNASVRL
ncbi:MAG: amino acid adenylation domain-containing protein, partial [Pseudomonadota bacterium]